MWIKFEEVNKCKRMPTLISRKNKILLLYRETVYENTMRK